MTTFRRGLQPKAWATLEQLAADPDGNWWTDLLDTWSPSGPAVRSRQLRLALRDDYFNLYRKGQSVARVSFDSSGRPSVHVHVKYVFEGSTDQGYARLSEGVVTYSPSGRSEPYAGASTLRAWIARAAVWETPEKAHVDQLVSDNLGVIDLEMGLPAADQQATALRIDVVALEPASCGARVVFWEAKRITDGRIRSRSARPEVMDQIEAYTRYFAVPERVAIVTDAYRETCRALRHFRDMASARAPLHLGELVSAVASGEIRLDLDPTPRLVVFGTQDQIAGRDWRSHEAKLKGLNVGLATIPTDGYRLPVGSS